MALQPTVRKLLKIERQHRAYIARAGTTGRPLGVALGARASVRCWTPGRAP